MLQKNLPEAITQPDHDHPHEKELHGDHEHGPGPSQHSHDHNQTSHTHSHTPLPIGPNGRISRMFLISLILNALFVVFQFTIGLWVNSLALISDAGHNLTDVMALAFSWWAMMLARRSPDNRKTYGYHRAGILAASLNAATLILIAFYVFYEGIQRLMHPEPVEGGVVAIVATVALILNGSVAVAFFKSSKEDLNVRSAFIHVLGDALSSVGVIIAGLAILLTGWLLIDPLISILIGLFILWSSWSIIKEATNVLLEGIPAGLDMVSLMRDLMAIENVKSVHDLHVWTLGSNYLVLSCHILTNETSLHEANATAQQIKTMLVEKYQIHHATIELECENCTPPGDLYCTVINVPD
jgi:cobalt-zinc-cadmium efflux system protein